MNPADLRTAPAWRGYALVWAVIGVGLMASVVAAAWLRKEAHESDAARFAGLVEQTRQDFDDIAEKYQQALQRLADAIGAREEFTQRHWDLQIYWLSPDVDFPGLSEIQLVRVSIATNLPPEFGDLNGDEFHPDDEAQLNQFQKANRIMGRAPIRLEPVWTYIAHSATDPQGVGMPGDPLQRQTVHFKYALYSHYLRVTGRRVILRYQSGKPILGTTLIVPIPSESLARGWSTNLSIFRSLGKADAYHTTKIFTSLQHTSAFLCGSIDWQMLIHTLVRDQRPELHLDLYAYPKPRTNNWLGGSGTVPLAPAEAMQVNLRTNSRVSMYGTKWTLAMHTTPLFDSQSTHYRAYVALVGGIVVTLLMAGLLTVQIRARVRQQTIAGELRKSLAALEAARAEREELGRDLHDGAIQSLYALQLGLSHTATQARKHTPAIAERLADYRRSVSVIISELRGFILRHEAECQPGADLCRVLDASLNRLRPTVATELRSELDVSAAARLSNEQAVHLANIAREALSNSLRHGSPRHIQLALGSENGFVKLEIKDDGCGFDPAGLPSGGMGLANMSVRARQAGGELRVETAPGSGARVLVKVPAKETPATILSIGKDHA